MYPRNSLLTPSSLYLSSKDRDSLLTKANGLGSQMSGASTSSNSEHSQQTPPGWNTFTQAAHDGAQSNLMPASPFATSCQPSNCEHAFTHPIRQHLSSAQSPIRDFSPAASPESQRSWEVASAGDPFVPPVPVQTQSQFANARYLGPQDGNPRITVGPSDLYGYYPSVDAMTIQPASPVPHAPSSMHSLSTTTQSSMNNHNTLQYPSTGRLIGAQPHLTPPLHIQCSPNILFSNTTYHAATAQNSCLGTPTMMMPEPDIRRKPSHSHEPLGLPSLPIASDFYTQIQNMHISSSNSPLPFPNNNTSSGYLMQPLNRQQTHTGSVSSQGLQSFGGDPASFYSQSDRNSHLNDHHYDHLAAAIPMEASPHPEHNNRTPRSLADPDVASFLVFEEELLYGPDSPDGTIRYYPCHWGTSCGTWIRGDKTTLIRHLRKRHGVTASDKEELSCAWGECHMSMKMESIPRHIVSTHLGITLTCLSCQRVFCREDAWRRHLQGPCKDNGKSIVDGPGARIADILPSVPASGPPKKRIRVE
ncbi:hypothetical protein BJ138DRAFT_1141572 [Hygrophoropsis aurantiaca]|uniref:Uncharacterized protein n=1 Tax=Hygrophoropsis aurantiaca TaxID=72124 RepID=A0ACB8AQP8_9AGAM|nr:hypothetical protein BJ138DRAFT_1141572 [Hygrophoropsis aurantiaca]